MTTNPTIDGVPRELLDRLIDAYACHDNNPHCHLSCDQEAIDKLRALLDAPTVESELDRLRAENYRLLAGFYQQVTDADIKKISDYMGNPDMPTGAFLRQDAYDLANMTTHMCREVQALRNKLAAQPQGEPVKPYGYMFHPDGKKEEEFFIYEAPKERVLDHRGEYWTATPLYAEQPAPVAVVPDGWTVVPLEATGVMKDAGAFGALPVSCANAWTAAAVWRAMINAAPSPQNL